MGKKDKRVGVVFSTDPDYDYEYEKDQEPETLPKNEQRLRLQRETKGRKGKEVTIIKGFVGKTDDKEKLSKKLKSKCGVGGSVVDEGILLQGDQRDKALKILKKEGYGDVKKAGG